MTTETKEDLVPNGRMQLQVSWPNGISTNNQRINQRQWAGVCQVLANKETAEVVDSVWLAQLRNEYAAAGHQLAQMSKELDRAKGLLKKALPCIELAITGTPHKATKEERGALLMDVGECLGLEYRGHPDQLPPVKPSKPRAKR